MQSLESQLLTYVLNSLWQVPLIFAAAWLAARAARRSGPSMEHRVWVSALALEVLLPACSIPPGELFHRLTQLLPWSWGTHALHADAHVTVVSGPGYAHGLLHLPTQLLAIAALAYGCIFVYFATRFLSSLRKTHNLRRTARRIALTGAADRTWTRYSNLFAVHDAEVAVSSEVSCPVTLGIRRRLVLLPAEIPASLKPDDLDAALAHEFAHMRRRDFAKNLVYALLTLPIAYHPLLWLTRARIDETREMICDAMAATALAGPQKYASSLLRLASLLLHDSTDTNLHAIGIFDANIFERRIMNLTQQHLELRGLRRLATAAACIALGFATCASALALRMNVVAPTFIAATTQSTDAGTKLHVPAHVIAGNRLNFVQPIYPKAAKKAKLDGTVVLHAIIGKQGNIEKLDVVSGPTEFQHSALDAVKQWTYKPYLLNGNPVAVETTITVSYSLQK